MAAQNKAPPTAEKAISHVCKVAGPQAEEALLLLQKLFNNISDNPSDPKFRRINPGNAKLKSVIFCHSGALEFLAAAGFTPEADGTLKLGDHAGVTFGDANSALRRCYARLSDMKQRQACAATEVKLQDEYRASVEGGAKGAGQAELEALARRPDGDELLKLLERILVNLRRFPGDPKYKTIDMTKASAAKVGLLVPLLSLAGFAPKDGNRSLDISRQDVDVIERIHSMAWWACQKPPADVRPANAGMNSVLGMVLGVAIGDALGAPLEGKAYGAFPTAEEVDKAFEMCGGGTHGVSPGQVTEDTELAVCLATGLAAPLAVGCSATAFPADSVSTKYGEWAASRPFDMGAGGMVGKIVAGPSSDAPSMGKRAMMSNGRGGFTQTNGALMRIAPLAAWGASKQLPTIALAEAAREDARLTHPDIAACDANAAYVIAAAHLITSGGDRAGALAAVGAWAQAGGPEIAEGVGEWLQEALGSSELPFGPQINHARIGFAHAFRHLQTGSSFERAMRCVLAGGGKTDTNAAIVGGLVGAAVGLQGLPPRWVKAVLAADTSTGQHRPPEYHPNRLPALMSTICGV